jgi:hypothetical protein
MLSLIEIGQAVWGLLHVDRQTDMAKLMGGFQNCVSKRP